jgi:hypothetical protein
MFSGCSSLTPSHQAKFDMITAKKHLPKVCTVDLYGNTVTGMKCVALEVNHD